jgi:UDP-glucose 4-epimerase
MLQAGYSIVTIKHDIFMDTTGSSLQSFFEVHDVSVDDTVIHLAAVGVSSSRTLLENLVSNVIGTETLLKVSAKMGMRRFLITGSCFEYGLTGNSGHKLTSTSSLAPLDNHSISKSTQFYLARALAHELGLDLTYIRLFQVFGPGESSTRLYPALRKAIDDGADFPLSSGMQVRDFTHVDYVCKFLINELKLLRGFQVINAASGHGTSVKDFAEFIWEKNKASGKLLLGSIPQKQPLFKYLVGEPTLSLGRERIAPFYLHPDV